MGTRSRIIMMMILMGMGSPISWNWKTEPIQLIPTPCPRFQLETYDAKLDENNTFVLSGKVHANGDAKITDFGIILSQSIDYSSGQWVRAKGKSEAFGLGLVDTNLTGTVYFRSWAKNVAGYGVGPVKRVEILEPAKAWWGKSEQLVGGWAVRLVRIVPHRCIGLVVPREDELGVPCRVCRRQRVALEEGKGMVMDQGEGMALPMVPQKEQLVVFCTGESGQAVVLRLLF